MNCPLCGRSNAYHGLRLVECRNRKCANFKAPPRTGIEARVHWSINGKRGNSRIIDLVDAEIRAEDGNEEHGKDTHWVIKEDEDTLWDYAIH